MFGPRFSRTARMVAALLTSGTAACGFDDDFVPLGVGTGWSTPSRSYSDQPFAPRPTERSYVTPRGDMIFSKPRETTIVDRNGRVTVIQRDRDGTRTIVGSGGVKVIPPSGGRRRQ